MMIEFCYIGTIGNTFGCAELFIYYVNSEEDITFQLYDDAEKGLLSDSDSR